MLFSMYRIVIPSGLFGEIIFPNYLKAAQIIFFEEVVHEFVGRIV